MARWARTPAGQLWKVRRLVLPDALRIEPFEAFSPDWREHGTGRYLDTSSSQHGMPAGNFGVEGLVGIVLWLIVVVLMPLILPLAFLVKIALRRPWWVEARRAGQTMRWRVCGFREADRAAADVADALAAGIREPSPPGGERVYYWGSPAALEHLEARRRRSAQDI